VNTSPPLYQFNIDQYEMMRVAAILGKQDRVELIEGEIRSLFPVTLHHMAVVNRLTMAMTTAVGHSAIVSVQHPIVLNRYNQPQPDLAVLKYRDDFYNQAFPRPEDILLLIEVADTSAHFDRTRKKSIYATNGIKEYWLVDIARGQVEQYNGPIAGDYHTVSVLKRGQQIRPAAMPEIQFEIIEILGPEATSAHSDKNLP